MWQNIPQENKRRYSVIVFIVLPICFIVGFLISAKIALLLNYKVDSKGAFIVFLSLVPLYIMSVIVVNRKLKNKSNDNHLRP
jgi:hypothetical protein